MIRLVSLQAAVGMAVLAAVLGCAPAKPAKMSEEEEHAKAFAELDKNDKDESSGKKDATSSSSDEKPKGPVYPAPFTAEQIREASRSGRTYRYKVEIPDRPSREYAITLRNVDDNGAEIHRGESSRRMGWRAMQQDSEFPKDRTTTHKEKLKTPAGKFECTVYEVEEDGGEVWTFFFAKKLPGAPVFFYVERNGKRLRTTTLVEYLPGK